MTDEQFWRLQGRLNSIELILQIGVLNLAQTQPDPFGWVQAYIEAVRQSSATMIPDVMSDEQAKRIGRETKAAVDDFVAELVSRTGHLKGAPDNPL